MKHSVLVCILAGAAGMLFSCSGPVSTNVRTTEEFTSGWKFTLGDYPDAAQPVFDDGSWRTLDLPHDWSIEGSFDPKNPAGTGGGALPGGIGWYRKTFELSASDSSSIFYIDFDGVYRNSEVWINGHYLGKRPYGYSSFRYELTPWLIFGGKNVIAVRVDNSKQPNSRWYSGSGIYRNVWLVKTGKVHVNHWGTSIITSNVTEKSSHLKINTVVRNTLLSERKAIIKTHVFAPEGRKIMTLTNEISIPAGSMQEISQEADLMNPVLWSIEKPVLYKAVTEIYVNGQKYDDYTTPFGIRFFEFNREKGFFLNGKFTKIKGVCNHHDLGCLGAAINTRALERQLEILKAMGANAIRTSHNPPAPELLDLCDRMGFLVMDEAFDMWKMNKTPFDYGLDFDEWHEADLRDMILRDRNHPSVIIWSIGNEIPEQWDTSGLRIAPELAGIVKSLDPTRPITSACNNPNPKNYIIRSNVLDLIGYNYHIEYFPSFLDSFQRGAFIASETTSALATRGSYDMPSDSVRIWPTDWRRPDLNVMNKDFTCSAYDNCRVPWGSTHEATWKVIKKYDFLSGLFIWTGFDYLGEPTPYPWPARSSYFGIVDLAGFPKDAYYMYQSEWTNTPVLHIFPHWNWKEGQMVDVWAYSNAEEVELFLNGKSLGTKRKQGDDLHLMWRVAWEPGTVKAIARTGGKEVLTKEIHTAGKPARILLEPDRTRLKADGKDLSFVKVSILDAEGNVVPFADNLVKFQVIGEGKLRATDNGNPISMESFQAAERKAFHGLCLAVVQASSKAGKITLKASSDGLPEASVAIATE